MTKILIAEDDEDIRNLIVLTLQLHGFYVDHVKDGKEAVEKAQTDTYDIILMDVRMPRMTGYDACLRLKEMEKTADIPVIFLSAKGQDKEIKKGIDVGAIDYILKPFEHEILINTIKKALDLP